MSLSQKPHPPNTFVENKSQSAIRKACQKAVDNLFFPFSGRQFISISALFSRFYCSVGRGLQVLKAARRKFAAPQTVILNERCNRE